MNMEKGFGKDISMKKKWIEELYPLMWKEAVRKFYGRDFIGDVIHSTVEWVLTGDNDNINNKKKEIPESFDKFKKYVMDRIFALGMKQLSAPWFNVDFTEETSEPLLNIPDFTSVTQIGKKDLEDIVDSMVREKILSKIEGRILKLRLYGSLADVAHEIKKSRTHVYYQLKSKILPKLEKFLEDSIYETELQTLEV